MIDRFTSGGGRNFIVSLKERTTSAEARYSITHDEKPAGVLFCGLLYGRTKDGAPRWWASTRDLYWRYAADAPMGVGFDVAAFDDAETAIKAWGDSADQILDWHAGKPVNGMYGRVQKAAS